jgi:hypothetical protein
MNNETARVVTAAIGGTLMGIGIGYQIAAKKLSLEFEQRLESETREMKTFYEASPNGKKYPTPQDAVAELIPEQAGAAILEYQGNDPVKVAYDKIMKSKVVTEEIVEVESNVDSPPEIEFPTVSQNIFEAQRDANRPYIITEEMFLENEHEMDQASVTFHRNGEKVSDRHDDEIEDYDKIIGTDFKSKFGVGSSDENTVYVRNEFLKMDFEISLSENSFEQDVLGEEPPVVKPSARQRREEQ